MARVRLIQWKASEAAALLANLRAAGHVVDYNKYVKDAPPRPVSATR